MKEVGLALISCLSILVPAYLIHIREIRNRHKKEILGIEKAGKDNVIKLAVLDSIMDLTYVNSIKNAVDRMFDATIADRFLILMAINGKDNFNSVSVIFEQHKNRKLAINATARYRNVDIDSMYRDMLKQAEREGMVTLETSKMEPCLLRDFYEYEKVSHAKVRHLLRKSVDEDNDVLIYSTLATHIDRPFSRLELSFIKTQYEGSIIPDLVNVLKK